MQVISKVRHGEVTQEIRDYAETKLGHKCLHYLPEHNDSIIAEVEFDQEPGEHNTQNKRVDLTITLPHQHLPLHIEESDATFKEAVDRAVDRLDQPLERYKETL